MTNSRLALVYLLGFAGAIVVASYAGFRDFLPVLLEGTLVTIEITAMNGFALFFAYDDVLFGGTHAPADAAAGATVGIQWAASAGNFAQFSFNTASLTNGQVISFTPGTFNYLWTPNSFLSADNIANPVATAPSATTAYSVQVLGSNGCSSTGTPIFASFGATSSAVASS